MSSLQMAFNPRQLKYKSDGTPILSADQIETIATEVLTKHCPHVLTKPHQFPVMLEDHLRRIPRFQRHLCHVLHIRHPVTDKRMPQRILLPRNGSHPSSAAVSAPAGATVPRRRRPPPSVRADARRSRARAFAAFKSSALTSCFFAHAARRAWFTLVTRLSLRSGMLANAHTAPSLSFSDFNHAFRFGVIGIVRLLAVFAFAARITTRSQTVNASKPRVGVR